MAGENDAVTLVGYRVDTGSVAKAVQANKQVEASLKSIGVAASSNALRFDSIAQAQAALGLSATQLGITETAVTSELQRQLPLAERLAEAARARASAESGTAAALRTDAFGGGTAGGTAAGSGRTVGQNITRFGRGLFNAPDVGGSTAIARAAIAGGAIVDKLGLSVGQLGAVAGVAGVAAVAVAVALDRFNQGLAESKKLLEGALAAQSNYFAALASNTSEQATAQIAELQRTRPLLQQQAEEARGALDSAFAQLQRNNGDLSARLLITAEAFAPLRDAATEAEAALQENIQTEERLTQGREAGAFEANDLAAAEEALREVREAATENIVRGATDYADSFVRASELTTAEREKEIGSIERQIANYQAVIASGNANGNTISALNGKIGDLQNQLAGLQDATSGYADALAREEAAKEALTEREEKLIDLVDQEVAAREDLFDIQQKIAEIGAEREEKLAELAADASERRQDIEIAGSERIAEIAEDNADRRAKLERDLGRSINEAIGNRDANAFRQAQIRAADALADQQSGVDKQVANVVKGLAKQEAAIDKSYDKQVANVEKSTSKALATQQRALADTEFLIASSQAAQAFLAANGMGNVNNAHVTGWQLIENTVVTYATRIAGAVQGILGGGSSFPTQQSFPTLTNSPQGRALDNRIDARFNLALRSAVQINGRLSPR